MVINMLRVAHTRVFICVTSIVLVASIVALTGCGRGVQRGQGGPMPKPPVMPPPPPPRVVVAIDQTLRTQSMQHIEAAFASSDPFLRANAVEATQRAIGAQGAARVIAALDDSEAVVRFAGTMAAGSLELKQAYPKLKSMLDDTNPSVCVAVRYALHRLGDVSNSRDLEIFSTSPDARVRANVALALGLLGEPTGIRLLRPMQADIDPAARMQAFEAMYRLGDERAREKLIIGTVSAFPDDQIISLLALAGPRDNRVFKVLAGKLTSDYPEVSLAAARALGMIGSDDGMTVALKSLSSNDPRQRAMAALALGDIGRADAQGALGKLLRDATPSVRLAAATAILQLK